jgi:site-specific DNA-methyltransferase (adenine-specific)
MTRDDFMENTLDVWEIPPESATRIGHPAPFPIELVSRLIELYTYRDDLVLDPFIGSGTTAVAAIQTERHFVGYDLDESYIKLAESRIEEENRRLFLVNIPAIPAPTNPDEDLLSRSVREGKSAKEIARYAIEIAGFTDILSNQHQPGGIVVDFTAKDRRGNAWLFDVAGSFTSHRGGLKRTDILWKELGRAAVLSEVCNTPLVLLTTDIPTHGAGAEALKAVVGQGKPIHAVVEMLNPTGLEFLATLCER